MVSNAEVAAAIAVATVLRAPDHYAAIDAQRSATTAELRQCFVRTSLRVHPDKNGHPEATRAFQRVAAAWRELGDEQARWRYDQQLSMGYGGSDDVGVQGCDSVPPDEAFAAFARASAACAACGGFADCADTLLFAQQMAQAQAKMQQNAGFAGGLQGGFPGGFPGQPIPNQMQPQNLHSVGTGLAYSAGLYTAGIATSAAGFSTVGSFMRRVALVQGFGQAAMGGLVAYQNPEVRRSIDVGVSHISERTAPLTAILASAGSTVRSRVEDFGLAERAAPMKEALLNVGAAIKSRVEDIAASEVVDQLEAALPSSCIPRPGRLSAGETPSKEALHAGARVTLANLGASAALNGRLCEVMRYEAQRDRYVVRLLPVGVRVLPSGGASTGGSGCSPEGSPAENMKLVKADKLKLAVPIPRGRAPKSATQFM